MLGIQTRVCKNGRHRRNHGAMESEEVTFTIYFLKTWVKKVGPYVSFSFFLSFFLSFFPAPKNRFQIKLSFIFRPAAHVKMFILLFFFFSHTPLLSSFSRLIFFDQKRRRRTLLDTICILITPSPSLLLYSFLFVFLSFVYL